MTAYTSTGSGDFNNPATWGGGGSPSASGDTFTVSVGHSVKYNIDNSATTGFGASTVNGTLYADRTPGVSLYLKMSGSLTIGAAGTLDVSDGAGGAWPASSLIVFKFTTSGTIGFNSNTNSTYNIRSAEPTHKYIRLSGAAAISATVLNVDTDVTIAGDSAQWKVGQDIAIVNVATAQQVERRTISAISGSQITISAGLTASKATGSIIVTLYRNIQFIGPSAGSSIGINNGANVANYISMSSSGWYDEYGAYGTYDGVSYAATDVTYHATNIVFNGVAIGTATSNALIGLLGLQMGAGSAVLGFPYGIRGANYGNVDVAIQGLFAGNTVAVLGVGKLTALNATFTGNTTGISYGTVRLMNCTFSGTGTDFDKSVSGTAYNCTFGSTTTFGNNTSAYRRVVDTLQSVNDGNVSGAFKAYPGGGAGTITSVASPVYTGRTRSYKHACASASAWCFYDETVVVPAGKSLSVTCYIQKDASMSYLPRLWIFAASKEPFLSGSPDVEAIMTNSTNVWETLTGSVTNSADSDQTYIVRVLAQNASGNVYSDVALTVGGGSSGVAVANLEGGVLA